MTFEYLHFIFGYPPSHWDWRPKTPETPDYKTSAAFAIKTIPRGTNTRRYGRPTARTSLRKKDRQRGSELKVNKNSAVDAAQRQN